MIVLILIIQNITSTKVLRLLPYSGEPLPPHSFIRFLNKTNHFCDLFSHKICRSINVQ